ncbi:MAG: TrpR binding protein WrbA [Bacillota bacterium]|nr:MAG: TrpR binding protein WrbA [Bacillota bacterium]
MRCRLDAFVFLHRLGDTIVDLKMNGGTALSKVNLAIVYYSSTGTNYQLAQWAAEGGIAAGADVKVFKVLELAHKR